MNKLEIIKEVKILRKQLADEMTTLFGKYDIDENNEDCYIFTKYNVTEIDKLLGYSQGSITKLTRNYITEDNWDNFIKQKGLEKAINRVQNLNRLFSDLTIDLENEKLKNQKYETEKQEIAIANSVKKPYFKYAILSTLISLILLLILVPYFTLHTRFIEGELKRQINKNIALEEQVNYLKENQESFMMNSTQATILTELHGAVLSYELVKKALEFRSNLIENLKAQGKKSLTAEDMKEQERLIKADMMTVIRDRRKVIKTGNFVTKSGIEITKIFNCLTTKGNAISTVLNGVKDKILDPKALPDNIKQSIEKIAGEFRSEQSGVIELMTDSRKVFDNYGCPEIVKIIPDEN